jgi:hypothetical protein
MSCQFHPDSETEHLETIAYYEAQQPGLGASYLADFELTLERVCEAPSRHPIERRPDIARIKLQRFPFTVIMGTVQVPAVAHHRRRPSFWLSRL